MGNFSNKSKAIWLTLICVIAWAFIPVVSKLWQNNLDNLQFLFYSSILSLIVVFISTLIAWKASEFKKYKTIDFYKVAWLSFLGAFFYYVLLYYWYANASWLEVIILQYTWPILTVFFSLFFLKEKINLKTIFVLILWFIWVLIVLTKWDISQVHLDNLKVDLIVLI